MKPGRPLTPDEGAWLHELVRCVGPRLHAAARRLYPSAADDLVADVFCRAAGAVSALQRADRPDLYLLTVLRNLVHDRVRRPALPRGSARPDGAPASQPVNLTALPDAAVPSSTGDDPLARATRTETHGEIERAVTDLPLELREIIVLRFSAGLSFDEIAALLRVPLGTALSRSHSAMTRLREALGVTSDLRV